ncbi:hypothetical protein [Burkholderia pyrrocinia]|uniref:hypothetical protein n=1 Tax=Burkholderia pyrrocinia TaxID=60550 RepID=UPI002AB2469C|nr:hypothetical protein [Burkholderia pyrrocinia]
MPYLRVVMTVRPVGPAQQHGNGWPTGLPTGRQAPVREARRDFTGETAVCATVGRAPRAAGERGFAAACFSRWTAADYPIEFLSEYPAARAA